MANLGRTTARTDPALDADWPALLTTIRLTAWRHWQRQGRVCDLDVYLDAGYDALVRALERYDPARGVTFRTYAARCLEGPIRDAATDWQVWRDGRRAGGGFRDADVLRPVPWTPETTSVGMVDRWLATLPAARQRYAQDTVLGYSTAEHAQREGVHQTTIDYRRRQWQRDHPRTEARR